MKLVGIKARKNDPDTGLVHYELNGTNIAQLKQWAVDNEPGVQAISEVSIYNASSAEETRILDEKLGMGDDFKLIWNGGDNAVGIDFTDADSKLQLSFSVIGIGNTSKAGTPIPVHLNMNKDIPLNDVYIVPYTMLGRGIGYMRFAFDGVISPQEAESVLIPMASGQYTFPGFAKYSRIEIWKEGEITPMQVKVKDPLTRIVYD